MPRHDRQCGDRDSDDRTRCGPEDDRSRLDVEQPHRSERAPEREDGTDDEYRSTYAGCGDRNPAAHPEARRVGAAREGDDVADDPHHQDRGRRRGEYEERPDRDRSGGAGGSGRRGTAALGSDGGHYVPSDIYESVDCGLSLHRAGVAASPYLNPRPRTARF